MPRFRCYFASIVRRSRCMLCRDPHPNILLCRRHWSRTHPKNTFRLSACHPLREAFEDAGSATNRNDTWADHWAGCSLVWMLQHLTGRQAPPAANYPIPCSEMDASIAEVVCSYIGGVGDLLNHPTRTSSITLVQSIGLSGRVLNPSDPYLMFL